MENPCKSWNEAMAANVPWQKAYKTLATTIRGYLVSHPTTGLKSRQLVEILYPSRFCQTDEDEKVRKRMFEGLMAQARHELADCCRRGEGKGRFGQRPWLWFTPPPKAESDLVTCPHCYAQFVPE